MIGSMPAKTTAVAIATAGSRRGRGIPTRVDPEPEDAPPQVADAVAPIGECGGDERGRRQCEGRQQDERRDARQLEIDDAESGGRQERQCEDDRG